MLFHPSCRAAHHLHSLSPRLQVVAVSRLWGCKFNGHVSAGKSLAVEILLVIDIDNAHNVMTTVFGNLLNHLAHLPVAD